MARAAATTSRFSADAEAGSLSGRVLNANAPVTSAPSPCPTTPNTGARIRTVLFGSFYRGYCLLDALMASHRFNVVGVATDDPTQSFVARERRVWSYPHQPWEATMVEDLAVRHGLPVYKSRVRTPAFRAVYSDIWQPELCISATFGQRFDEPLFRYPRLGFYNLHPCHEGPWPSPYAGPNPFQALIDDGRDHCAVALHRVDADLDTGELIAWSPRIPIPPGVGVIDMHKMSAPLSAHFCLSTLLKRLDDREHGHEKAGC